MNSKNTHKVLIKYPEVGFEQVVCFDTFITQKDRKGIEQVVLHHERDVEIVYLGFKNEEHRYQIFLLESRYDLNADFENYKELWESLSYVADECFVKVDAKGRIFGIINLEFIQYRWNYVVRPILIEQYTEEDFLAHIYRHDQILKDEKSFLEYLNGYKVYGNYFNPYQRISYTCADSYLFDTEEEMGQLQESIICKLLSSYQIQVVELQINGKYTAIDRNTGAMDINPTIAKYTYVGGKLEEGIRIIEMKDQKLKYNIRWVGLRKIEQ